MVNRQLEIILTLILKSWVCQNWESVIGDRELRFGIVSFTGFHAYCAYCGFHAYSILMYFDFDNALAGKDTSEFVAILAQAILAQGSHH